MDLSGGKRLIGGLKSKLGLGSRQAAQDYDPEYDDYFEDSYEEYDAYDGYADDYGDGYGDYGEFEAYGRDYRDDEYGYDDDYGYPSDGYRDSRRMNSDMRSRNVGRDAGYPAPYDAPRGARGRGGSGLPRLLSIDEVRDRTRASRAMRFDDPSNGFADDRDRSSRTGSSSPFSRRSGGLTSMPAPLAEPALEQSADAHSGRFLSLLNADASSPNGDVSRIRALTVLKPVRYGEAERITEVLKKDDVAVLDLRGTTKGLDKRILDFSFGAASVLDASVECVADKVFVVCAGGLTQEERAQLQAQGVI